MKAMRSAWLVVPVVGFVVGLGLALGLGLGPSAAEPFGLAAQRALETPAHEALMVRAGRQDYTPAPFVGDGCSGGLSFAWRTIANHWPAFARAHLEAPPYELCCDANDRA